MIAAAAVARHRVRRTSSLTSNHDTKKAEARKKLKLPASMKNMMHPDTIRRLQDKFLEFDIDMSGQIDREELCLLLRSTGMNPAQSYLEELFEKYDEDGNGVLSFKEFALMWNAVGEEFAGDDELGLVESAFRFFDSDGGGTIERSEFRTMMLELGDPLTEEEIGDFFSAVDVNNDGTMSYQEFVDFLRKDMQEAANAGLTWQEAPPDGFEMADADLDELFEKEDAEEGANGCIGRRFPQLNNCLGRVQQKFARGQKVVPEDDGHSVSSWHGEGRQQPRMSAQLEDIEDEGALTVRKEHVVWPPSPAASPARPPQEQHAQGSPGVSTHTVAARQLFSDGAPPPLWSPPLEAPPRDAGAQEQERPSSSQAVDAHLRRGSLGAPGSGRGLVSIEEASRVHDDGDAAGSMGPEAVMQHFYVRQNESADSGGHATANGTVPGGVPVAEGFAAAASPGARRDAVWDIVGDGGGAAGSGSGRGLPGRPRLAGGRDREAQLRGSVEAGGGLSPLRDLEQGTP